MKKRVFPVLLPEILGRRAIHEALFGNHPGPGAGPFRAGSAGPTGEVAEIFEVLTGSETESGYVNTNGMRMFYTVSEEGGSVVISYTWMDRGNSVTMEFTYAANDPSVRKTVNSIIGSIRFDAGH